MPKTPRLFYWITGLALLLSACSLPTSGIPASPSPNAAYTAAAETIIAQLTQIAGPTTVTPPASPAAALPSATGNPVPSEAAATPAPTNLPTPEPTTASTTVPTEAPGATLAATASFTPTLAETAALSPTASGSDPRTRLGEPTFRDTFASGDNWPLYQDEHVQMEISAAKLQMKALRADKWESWMLSWPEIHNFYLEVTAAPGECQDGDRYGLLARAPDASHGYLLGFTCDGRYSLRTWDGKSFTTLVDWTSSAAIHTGANATNRLGFMAQGSQLNLYANGTPLTSATDSTYTQGAFGLFLGAAQTPGFTVQFSEVAYWDLP